MQFIKPDININFIGKSKITLFISLAMILISLASLLIHKGPRYGIDFAGGTLIQVKFLAPANIADIKSGLSTIDLKRSSVQQFGDLKDNEYLIRTDIPILMTQADMKYLLYCIMGDWIDFLQRWYWVDRILLPE